MKKKFIAWFNWKNPDEMRSKILAENTAEINLVVRMTYAEFAELIEKLGRSDFTISFEKKKS